MEAIEASKEVPLTGGRQTAGVMRVGDTVRRPTGPHSTFVHNLLRDLETIGFGGAPRMLGIDERGREILTYVEGEVPHDEDARTTRTHSRTPGWRTSPR